MNTARHHNSAWIEYEYYIQYTPTTYAHLSKKSSFLVEIMVKKTDLLAGD